MAVISNFGCNLLLGSVFTPDATANLSNVYVALTLDVPHKNISGSDLSEPDATANYARAEYYIGSDYWSLTEKNLTNTQQIIFNVPSDQWGRIAGWALCDDPDSGNVLACGNLSVQASIEAGADVRISIGDLKIRLV